MSWRFQYLGCTAQNLHTNGTCDQHAHHSGAIQQCDATAKSQWNFHPMRNRDTSFSVRDALLQTCYDVVLSSEADGTTCDE